MKRYFLITLLLVSSFGLGWWLNDMTKFANGVIEDKKSSDSLIIKDLSDRTKEHSNPKITGVFILKNSNCAGFNFIDFNKLSWTNEMDCAHPDTMQLRWLDSSTFFVKDINRINESCPPRVWIFQVVSFNGNKLILKDIWTGWNNYKDEMNEYIRRNN